jgi:hypothetical protein
LGMRDSRGLGNIELDSAIEAALLLGFEKGGLTVCVAFRELRLWRHRSHNRRTKEEYSKLEASWIRDRFPNLKLSALALGCIV